MSKKRLFGGAVFVTVLAAASVLALTASARPAKQDDTVKLGFITKFPVDFYFTLVDAAKAWDKSTPGASVIYASGKSGTDDAGEIAAIQNMLAQGVKGIAITPTSPAVSATLDKAIKQGVKVVLIDNDIPTWKSKSSVVATNNFNGGVLAGKYLATKLKAGDTLGILEGVPGNPALVDRVTGMLAGLGALKSKIKVVSKLETDCDQTKGAAAAQTILTANKNLTAIYSACGPPALGAIQSIKNAGIKPGRDHPGRLRRLARRGEGDQGGHRDRQRRAVPVEDGLARHRDALQRGHGQEGAEERRHRHRARHEGERRPVLGGRLSGERPAGRGGGGASPGSANVRIGAMTTMIVDAHHHFWNLDREAQPWMTDDHDAIRRTFEPADLEPLLDRGRSRRRPCSSRPPAPTSTPTPCSSTQTRTRGSAA